MFTLYIRDRTKPYSISGQQHYIMYSEFAQGLPKKFFHTKFTDNDYKEFCSISCQEL